MLVVVVVWLVGVVAFDLARRRAPNAWMLAGAGVALVALTLGDSPLGVRWPNALAGAAAGFLVLLVFYAMGLMGAGDVKFAGALGLWLGWVPLVPIAVGASLLAGIHAVLWLCWRHRPGQRNAAARPPITRTTTRPIPYAGYLALTAIGWISLRLHGMPA